MATTEKLDQLAQKLRGVLRPKKATPKGPPPRVPFPLHLTAQQRAAIESGAQFSEDELSPEQYAEFQATRPAPAVWLGR